MFSTTLAATTWYADLALVILIVGFAAVGAVRGFGRSMKGFFMTITVVLLSLLLMGVLHDPIMNSSLGTSLSSALAEKSAGWGPEFNEVIHFEGDVKFIIVDGARQNLVEMGLKGMVANTLADLLITEYGVQSLAGLCIHNLSSLIISVCTFVASCLVLTLLCAILRGVTQNMEDSKRKSIRVTNRVLGGVVGLVLGAVAIMTVFAVFRATADKIPQVIQYINDSVICKFFYDLNPIGQALASIFAKQ
jgi:hypothetical protein